MDFCRPFSQACFTCLAEEPAVPFILSVWTALSYCNTLVFNVLLFMFSIQYYCKNSCLTWFTPSLSFSLLVLFTGLNTGFYWIKSCFTCIPIPTCPCICYWMSASVAGKQCQFLFPLVFRQSSSCSLLYLVLWFEEQYSNIANSLSFVEIPLQKLNTCTSMWFFTFHYIFDMHRCAIHISSLPCFRILLCILQTEWIESMLVLILVTTQAT